MRADFKLPFQPAPDVPELLLSAVYEEPPGGAERGAVLLAHGAGYELGSPFMERLAQGFLGLGYAVERFHYPYRERAIRAKKRMLPVDPRARLEAAHALALAELVRRSGDSRPVLAGKSLGARVSTLLAAKDHPARALVLFGYPLHPEGAPERERSEHFPAIAQPALFLAGDQDPLCELPRLRAALARFGGPVALEVLPGADHSFRMPKSAGLSEADVHAWLMRSVALFLDAH
jgi:hypothetical protein